MTLRDYARVFAHRWVLIALVTLTTAAATWLITPAQSVSNTAQSHTATATLLADSQGSETGGGLTLGRISLFIRTGVVPQRVAEQIGYAGEPALLGNQITVTTDPESGSISIASTERTPEQATLVANTFADQAVAFFEEGGSQTSSTRLMIQQGAVAVANEGGVGNILPPGRAPRTALAALLGLLLGMGIALVIERFDSRMRDRREIQAALGMPIIGEIQKLRGKERQHASSIVAKSPRSAPADGYRAARTAVAHSLNGSDLAAPSQTPLILVTSANPGEGKTTSVANLALSFAESGKSVLVLDADFHSPDLHRAFDVPQGVGISDYIHDPGAWSLESLARPTNAHGIRIITAGTRVEHPATLASRTGALLEASRHLADVVIVDSAPVLAASDMFDIIPLVDIVVLVARSGRLTENDATRVAELLGRFHVPLAGAITIGSKTPRGRRYGYGYGEYPAGRKGSPDRRKAREGRAEERAAARADRAAARDNRDDVVHVEDLFDDDPVSAGTTRRARREARSDDLDY